MKLAFVISLAILALGLRPAASRPDHTKDLKPKCGCKADFKPVCGKNEDGVLTDYPNRCTAGCAHATDVQEGECEHQNAHVQHRLCGCPPINDPVCGENPQGVLQTYDNRCKAGCADAKNIQKGPCPTALCGCPPIDEPVCGINPDGTEQTFDNKCEAGCAHATDIKEGRCPLPACFCPRIFMPVCGTLPDGTTQTFSNGCTAECEKATDVTPGECSNEGPIRLCGCPPIHDPVCGTKSDGSQQTFSNKCEAGCADATEITPGECSNDAPEIIICGCPPIDEPVCGMGSSNNVKTFPNECELGCARDDDYVMLHSGSCDEGDDSDVISPVHDDGFDIGVPEPNPNCICTMIYAPVCGTLPDGTRQTFGNGCAAECEQATDIIPGECGETLPTIPPMPPVIACICTEEYNPVCGTLPDGTTTTFSNPCSAKCDHATDVTPGECNAPVRLCGCPPINEPVCAEKSDGLLQTFSNKCEAGCADATVSHEGPCVMKLCGCPPIMDLVCGKSSTGELKTFENRCELGCAQDGDYELYKEGPCIPDNNYEEEHENVLDGNIVDDSVLIDRRPALPNLIRDKQPAIAQIADDSGMAFLGPALPEEEELVLEKKIVW